MEEGFFENFKAISTDMDNINFQRFATVIDYNGDTYTVREDDDNDVKHSNVLLPSNLSCEVGDKVIIGFIDNSIYNPVIIGNLSRGNLDDIHTDKVIEDYDLDNIGTDSGANQSEINQAIDTKLGFYEKDGDYFFTLDSFFDPNQWTGNPTISNGEIILVKDSLFPLRLPPNCKLTFEFYLGTLTYDVGDIFTFRILGRNIYYTLTQHDVSHGVTIDVSLDCSDNVCVFKSNKTGDTHYITNISSYKGLFVQVENGIPVTIRNIIFDDNSITVDNSLSTTSTNPVENRVITNALNNKANSSHNHTTSDITNFPSLATVATTGDYDDLTDKPTIPSKTSDLTNDGDGTNVFVKDNDARLSDARTPLTHNHDDRYYTENETDTLLNTKQNNLVSGTNIKTINNQSLLGSGNIDISGGGSITVDDQLDNTSTNPVQNKVITNALDGKSDTNHNHDDRYYTETETDVLLDTKQDLIEDTGWKNVTYNSGWTDYNNDNKLRYRRVGKVVEVRGWAKPSSNQTGTSFDIATISDTTCRPSSAVNVYSKGFSNYHFQFNISSAGVITINKFYNGTTSQSQATTSQVFQVQATYLVD